MGSFWSHKRQGSTDTSPPSERQSSNSMQSDTLDFGKSTFQRGKLPEMVEEVRRAKEKEELALASESIIADLSSSTALATARPSPSDTHKLSLLPTPQSPQMTTPDSPSLFSSPVKASINAIRGHIDVDVPLPASFLTSSFTSSFSSPSSSGYLPPSTPGLGNGMDGFEHFSPADADANPRNVGGWMPRFHEDFVLQAVQPVQGLLEAVKSAMRAEPSPSAVASPVEGGEEQSGRREGEWVTVSTALVADATNFSIRRLRLRRRVVQPVAASAFLSSAVDNHLPTPIPSAAAAPSLHSQQHSSSLPSVYGNPYLNIAPENAASDGGAVVEEDWSDEPVVAWDGELVDAVERVISRGGELMSHSGAGGAAGSATTSTPASMAASTKGGSSTSTSARASLDASVRGSAASSRSASLSKVVVGAVKERCGGGGGSKAREKAGEVSVKGVRDADGVGGGARDAKDRGVGREGEKREGERVEEVPKGECRAVVIGALEKVIRGVVAEEGRRDGDGPRGEREGSERGDSLLKEGVRRWVGDVEARW